jgi:hypothetical protein
LIFTQHFANFMMKHILLLGFIVFSLFGCQSKGSKDNPADLPASVLKKLEGPASVNGGQALADIYNGTNWNIVDVDIDITNLENGESRRVRLTTHKIVKDIKSGTIIKEAAELLPYSSGQFEGTCGNFLDGVKPEEKLYNIVGARGYQQ